MKKAGTKSPKKAAKKANEAKAKKELLHRIPEVLKPANKDGKTAYWLAKETGMPYNSIHRYLNNSTEPSLTNLKRIAEALGVDGKDLINF